MPDPQRVHVIDSHTGGEPTRLVLSGGPPLGNGPLADRLRLFQSDFDHLRSAIVNEPRGSDAIVGALLCEPVDRSCSAGVIFFNNVGYLGMCGHGTIGLVVTLAHLGRLRPGLHRIETPVGIVEAQLHDHAQVTVRNVPSYRWQHAVSVSVEGFGQITGDVAWGGNWFFLAESPLPLCLDRLAALIDYTSRLKRSLSAAGITGKNGAVIDHIELYGQPVSPAADSRNFVLCPGGSYDRSPCGTGTSAKMACLYAAGQLTPGQPWRQESITGSIFEGSVAISDGLILPSVRGSAFVHTDASLLIDERDPLRWGIRPAGSSLDRE